ncbi:MAG: ankyrin repeat domain-containing protein [Alphaproteobacteria bacterium]
MLPTTKDLYPSNKLSDPNFEVNAILPDSSKLLSQALIKRDYKTLAKLIAIGANIDAKDGFSQSARDLLNLKPDNHAKFAVKIGQIFSLKINAREIDRSEAFRLIDSSAKISLMQMQKDFEEACLNQDNKRVDELMKDHNFDVNDQLHNGETPLTFAIKNKYYFEIQKLLKRNAKVSIENYFKETALSLANKDIDPLIIEILSNPLGDFSEKVSARYVDRSFQFDLSKKDFFSKDIASDDYLLERADSYYAHGSLFEACQYGHAEDVKKYLKQGADIDKIYDGGITALQISYIMGHEEIIDILLSNNANPNILNKFGFTAIHFAYSLSLENFKKLLDHNANLFVNENIELNPFFRALKLERDDIFMELIKRGYSFNEENQDGHTILNLAVKSGNVDVVKRIIELGFDIDKVDKAGFSAIATAVLKENGKLIDVLAKSGCDINETHRQLQTPLHLACAYGNENVVNALLKHNANVNAVDKNGATPLHIACKENNANIAYLLLKNNADVNVFDEDEFTPLHHACLNENINLAKMLLNYGANQNALNKSSQMPLELALDSTQEKILAEFAKTAQTNETQFHRISKAMTFNDFVDELLKNADPSIRASLDQKSLIQEAFVKRFAELVKPDDLGKTCFHYACENGNFEIVNLFNCFSDKKQLLKSFLEIKDYQGKSCFHVACEKGHRQIVKKFLEFDCNPFSKDNEGKNSIHWAIENSNPHVFRTLLNRNSQLIFSTDDCGNLCLHLASVSGQLQIIHGIANKFLIDITNNDGKTALHLAFERGRPEIIEVLLNYGASPFVTDKNGKNCYDIALEKGFDSERISAAMSRIKAYKEDSFMRARAQNQDHGLSNSVTSASASPVKQRSLII